jgi:hypothetical protein
MRLPRRGFLHLVAGAAALPAVSRMAGAQAYPSRPMTIIVPFGPGSATDTVARSIALPLGIALKQASWSKRSQVQMERSRPTGGARGRRLHADPRHQYSAFGRANYP